MQERARKTRAKILKTAIMLFAGSGFVGTTIDDIAFKAKVNKQRIYHYFGSKQKLFEAALRQVFAEATAISEKSLAIAQASPENLPKVLLEAFFQLHSENPRFWRLLTWANLEKSININCLDGIKKSENQKIRAVFDHAVKQEILRPVSFEVFIFDLMSISYFYHSNARTLRHSLGQENFELLTTEFIVAETAKCFCP